MKKYIIGATTVLLMSSYAYAEEGVQVNMKAGMQVRPAQAGVAMPAIAIGGMMEPTITTGDATIDATVRSLQKEMQAKIEAIRAEYQAKIKIAIGDHKVSVSGGMNATATQPRMPMNKAMEDKVRSTGTMMRAAGEMMGGRERSNDDGDVEGVSADASLNENVSMRGGFFGFLRGIFGR